ncbi:MAG: hypothetical protein JW820_06980 [Spirochaetales bacterium]|nr:hypothetical protein [Spirochaetales bacterium]
MNRRSLVAVLILLTATGLAPLAAEGGDSAVLARAGVGLDVIDPGLAIGVGGGYRFAGRAGTMEILAEVYYSPYRETYTAGSNTFEYAEDLVIVSVRADWLFSYSFTEPGFFQILGVGFFAGSFSWENYNVTTDYTEENSYFASGALLNLGLGWSFRRLAELRLEVPVLVFLGDYGGVIAVAVPITAGVVLRF